MADGPRTLGEFNDLLARLQALRSTLVRDARGELAKTPAQAELINWWVDEAEDLLEAGSDMPGGKPTTTA